MYEGPADAFKPQGLEGLWSGPGLSQAEVISAVRIVAKQL